MVTEKRKTKRFEISGDYFFFPADKRKKIKCELENISETGACISSDARIKKDEIIYLHIKGSRNILLKSRNVWKIDDQYGLLFLLDTSQEFENISYIINYVTIQ